MGTIRRFSWVVALAAIVAPQLVQATNPIAQIQLTKTVSANGSCGTSDYLQVTPGTNVTYCYQATNTGDVPFTAHVLDDSMLGNLLTNFPLSLPPGSSYTTVTSTVINLTTTNTATWVATFTSPMAGTSSSSDMALVEVDTDGDGIRDEDDPHIDVFDPTGCFYNEETGEVRAGGKISVSGPAGVIIGADGSNGCYQFNAISAGTYHIGVLSYPLGCVPSTVCLDSGTLNPTSPPCDLPGPICTLGDPNVGGFISPSFACSDNPFFGSLNLPAFTPDVLNNNIPLHCTPAIAPALGPWGMALLGLVLLMVGFVSVRRMSPSTHRS